MQFQQYDKDGSCDIIFDDDEIQIIKKHKKLHLPDTMLRHFGNALIKIVSDWNLNFNEELSCLQTNKHEIVKGQEPKKAGS